MDIFAVMTKQWTVLRGRYSVGTGLVQTRWLKVISSSSEDEELLEQLEVLGFHLHKEVGESRNDLLIDIDNLREENMKLA